MRDSVVPLVALLKDEDEKTRANAAGALGTHWSRCACRIAGWNSRCFTLSAARCMLSAAWCPSHVVCCMSHDTWQVTLCATATSSAWSLCGSYAATPVACPPLYVAPRPVRRTRAAARDFVRLAPTDCPAGERRLAASAWHVIRVADAPRPRPNRAGRDGSAPQRRPARSARTAAHRTVTQQRPRCALRDGGRPLGQRPRRADRISHWNALVGEGVSAQGLLT